MQVDMVSLMHASSLEEVEQEELIRKGGKEIDVHRDQVLLCQGD
jgi:hypothetical protein